MNSPNSFEKYIPPVEDPEVEDERQEYLSETRIESFQFGAERTMDEALHS